MIDLDAARAARAEAQGEPETVTFGGETFELPPECPYAVAEAIGADNARAAVLELFGTEDGVRFMALDPTVPDLTELVRGLVKTYGLGSPGNSRASDGSSSNGSRRSKRTS